MAHLGQPCHCGCRGGPVSASSIDALVGFLHANLSDGEAACFLKQVAMSKGFDQPSTGDIWKQVRAFGDHHLTEDESARYLTVLQQRQLRGEPLLRVRHTRNT